MRFNGVKYLAVVSKVGTRIWTRCVPQNQASCPQDHAAPSLVWLHHPQALSAHLSLVVILRDAGRVSLVPI